MKKSSKILMKGVAALEFALVFPILFLILYTLITYSLIFAVQHSLTMAATEGGRAAVKYQSNNDPQNLRINYACAAADKNISWLGRFGLVLNSPGNDSASVFKADVSVVTCPFLSSNATTKCLDMRLVYKYSAHPLLPIFLLPVPKELTGASFTQFSLSF